MSITASDQETPVQPRRVPQELVDTILGSVRGKLWKETLANCSLVCKSWTPTSSEYLFEKFSWPCRIPGKPCCEGGTGSTCYVRLWDLLSSCSRISNAIRILEFRRHARGCSGGKEDFPMSLLLQIFDALPHLRSAKLPYSCFSRVLRSEPDTAPWLTDSRPRSLEELHVGAIAGTTVPVVLDLLSAFARISKLTFSCRVLSTSGGSQSYPPSPTLEVHSLTIRGRCDGLALQELQGFVKLNAIRDLSLSTSPTPAQPTLISFLQSIASLTSLEYRVDRMAAPAGLPVNVHLRSVRIFAELPVWRSKDMRSEQALLEMSEWGPAMRDLEVMVTADTRDVHITLTVVDTCITYVSPEGSDSDLFDDPEEIATAQERTFSRLDWKRLENIAQRWPTVETLRIWVIYQDAELATRCIGILRNAASRNLSSGVAGRLLINQTPYVSI